jgi:hypothetical protein
MQWSGISPVEPPLEPPLDLPVEPPLDLPVEPPLEPPMNPPEVGLLPASDSPRW